jgi:branched-chain amino acid transport system permease protein
MGALADYVQFVLMPQMFNGLTIGVAVILMALGLTIIFGLLDVFNMAHGEFYALGAYLGVTLAGKGVSFWLLLVLVPIALLPVGFLVDRALIQRVFHQKERHMLTMLLTFGLAIVMEDVFRAAYGPNTYRPEAPLHGGTEVLGNFFPTYRLFLVAIGAVTIAAVWLIVNRTRFGSMVRAAALDRHMAASLGVPVRRVYSTTFAFGVALAGLSGVLLSPVYSVFPTMGKDFILMAFTAVILGGFGSIRGVVLGGLVLTQIQALSSLYVSPVWGDPIVFGIMVLVLFFRPQGIFGGQPGHA